MAYIVPSVLVTQALINAGGVSNATPDLEVCIIGPAYNILSYVAGSLDNQIKTAAYGTTSTTGSMSLDGYAITVVSTAGFNLGDTILINGAGLNGATLQAIITDIAGNIITVDTAAATAVTSTKVSESGIITNPLVDNTFTLPGQIPGQVIDSASVSVWLNNVLVNTLTSGFSITPNSNVITMTTGSTTGGITAGQSTLVVASQGNFEIGDTITVANAGAAGGLLTTVITNIVGTTFTVSPAAGTTQVAHAVTKLIPVNLNSTTNTLRAESGDIITLSYVDSAVVTYSFTSTIQSVVTSSGLNGTIVNFTLNDSIPSVTAGGTVSAQETLILINKAYSDQLVPVTNPITSGSNIDSTLTSANGTIKVKSGVSLIYGPVISGDVFVAYRALRTDLSGSVLTINDTLDLEGQLVDTTDSNPLGLACLIALANTTGRVRAIAIASNDLAGHTAALTTAEGERLYFLVPLTQDQSILAAYKAHSLNMSTPINASWRTTLMNTAMPLVQNVGIYSITSPNNYAEGIYTTLVNGAYVLTAQNATFVSDGVLPGDIINFVAATATPTQVGAHIVLSVISNQQLIINTTATATAISYYITRSMSKTQTAEAVAAVSSENNTRRIVHVQPDLVGVSVNGVTKYLPGYYLCAGLGGMGAGFAVQQGFTNIGVAGIVDLQHSNFYFGKSDLNNMAGAGTCFFVQETQGGNPYCRHELTTDMTTLNSREILMVKELDYLSYFYYDKLKSFIGSWNITPSSINTLRQTIVAGSELIKSQSLPKIGAVLLSYNITKLIQDPVNTDHVTAEITVVIGTPMNYIDLTISV